MGERRLRRQGKGSRDLAKFLGLDGRNRTHGVMLRIVRRDGPELRGARAESNLGVLREEN